MISTRVKAKSDKIIFVVVIFCLFQLKPFYIACCFRQVYLYVEDMLFI